MESDSLKVNPPIHRLGWAGRFLRAQLMAGILRGTPVLVMIQNLRTPELNVVMKAVSFGGEEEFYTPVVAGIVWVADAKLGRQLVLLMALAFYIAGFLKNALCLPRPPCPPITPLQHCQDWGLPSHHAVLNVNIPWYIWFYASLNYSLSPASYVAIFVAVSAWSFCIMFSRMYLGVHSPADILTGGIIGCLLLALWLQVDDAVDTYIASGGNTILLFVVIVVLFLCLHPDPHPTTIVLVETVSMVSIMLGVVIGQCHAPPSILYASIERSHTYASTVSLLSCSVCRFVVGFTMLLVTKTTTAITFKAVLCYVGQVCSLPTVYVKRRSAVTNGKVHYSPAFTDSEEEALQTSDKPVWLWRPGQLVNLYIPVKFLSYLSTGVVVVAIAPYTFHLMGI